MLAAGDTLENLLEAYSWLEAEDIQACLLYARRIVAHERIEPLVMDGYENLTMKLLIDTCVG